MMKIDYELEGLLGIVLMLKKGVSEKALTTVSDSRYIYPRIGFFRTVILSLILASAGKNVRVCTPGIAYLRYSLSVSLSVFISCLSFQLYLLSDDC